MEELSPFEKLSLSTIRIECELENGGFSCGTGFYFKFVDKGDQYLPAIVTNKHVVDGAKNGFLHFTLAGSDGNPMYESHHKFTITNFQTAWRSHPNPDIDLCAIPIFRFVDEMNKQGVKPFINFLNFSLIPTTLDIDEMAGLERVVMVGYPIGLCDEIHNQPVFRSGVLASHYKFNWNGKSEFLIDLACVPGSSGSPVLLIDIGQVFTKKGLQIGMSRIKLLGVLYAGPVLSANGSIEIIPAPTLATIQTRTNIPINLGYVIKAEKLREFEAVFEGELNRKS